jgi:uncharacterized protein (TIRG00374 family)
VSQRNHKTATLIFLVFAGLVFLTLVTAALTEGPKLLAVLNDLSLEPLVFALACMAVSYLSIALSFSGLFELTPHRIPFSTMFSITFVAATFNYVVSTAGVSSLAVRAYLFKQHKVPVSTTLPLSVAQSMITNLVLALMCLGGLLHLNLHPEMVGSVERGVIAGLAGVLVLLVLLVMMVFFHPASRAFLLDRGTRWGGRLLDRVTKGRFPESRLKEIRHNLEDSIRLLHKGWIQLFATLFWIAMDWGFTAMTLYFCFQAVGVNLDAGLVLVGFTVAFLTSTINVVPAGLGITEMAVTGTYIHLLKVAPEKAVIATILFRIIYFLIPLAVSTALYLDTMRKAFRNQEK